MPSGSSRGSCVPLTGRLLSVLGPGSALGSGWPSWGGQPAGLPTGRELARLCVEMLLPVPHLVLMASHFARSRGRDRKKPAARPGTIHGLLGMKLSGGRGEPTGGGPRGLASPPSWGALDKSHQVSEPSFLIRKAGLPQGFRAGWLQVALEAWALSHCSGGHN